jgi:phosphate transport system protein
MDGPDRGGNRSGDRAGDRFPERPGDRPADRVVRHFQQELDQLKRRLLEMGGLAEEEVRVAIKGLVERDQGLIDRAITGDEPVNAMHIEVDNRCFTLLALYQPMAADLRAIVAAVKINTDLERVGDLAVNIAEAAERCLRVPPVKKLIDIPRMAGIAQTMLRDALDAFVRRDIALAQRVLDEDDKLDELKTQIFRELLTYMLQDPSTIEAALDLILISRHLERIGDHATNIAEDVIFIVSARDVRHHADLRQQ